MMWYEIFIAIIGSVGGVGGIGAFIITIYNAKSNKTTIDIGNVTKMLDESREEREELRKSHREYVEEVDARIGKFEQTIEKMDRTNRAQTIAIYSAYRCKLPERIEDCPVLEKYVVGNTTCVDCPKYLEENKEEYQP